MPSYTDTTHARRPYYSNAVYATARDAANATDVGTGSSLNCGQRLTGGVYYIWRTALLWDTSGLGAGFDIGAARINLFCISDSSVTDFDIVVQNGQPTYPHDPVAVGDYDRTKYAGSGGTFNTSGLTGLAYNSLELNATGLGWINKTGHTKLLLRSSRDIGGNVPGGDEYCNVGDITTVGREPILEVDAAVGGRSPAFRRPFQRAATRRALG